MKDLTPTRVRRLQDLFEQALAVPATERTALLDRESGNDDALREEVLALIAAHESSTTILGRALSFDRDLVGKADGSRWLGARLGPWRVTRVIGIGGIFRALRTIPVLAHEVRYDLSLIEVEARGMWQWGFFDAVVTAL